ncbi:helix-turn-helix domain-containing protein [Pseudomonas sp. URMO17WK12:I2]|uniref:helix-turn-helix domain-containing protein n=1 Tax=Pseudomonas sp. URMO17WK12:I2 TaxID=1261623 RepID=UPI000DAEA1A3|nr:helix-turn-helix transcriptional regulator [Pseudomonas sp. URMO17WK12:I2]PZW49726.1 helix-turn-helix protein [Pseudomonas sp. URMO17WK12:I2]
MDLPAKLKAIRKREGITQGELCELLEMSHSTLKKYEAGIIEMGLPPILKMANHPRFRKYTLWLLTDDISSASEQISPL